LNPEKSEENKKLLEHQPLFKRKHIRKRQTKNTHDLFTGLKYYGPNYKITLERVTCPLISKL